MKLSVQSQTPIRLNADFSRRACMRAEGAVWTPSPAPGISRRMLDRAGGETGHATSLVRYAPGSRFPEHEHGGGEEFVVLEGVFSDASGDFGPRTYVRNPPGTAHAPWTDAGCCIFVKLWQMRADDRALVRIDTAKQAWTDDAAGLSRLLLHAGPGERVEMQHWRAGAELGQAIMSGGREILVLDGAFEDDEGIYNAGDWLRLPAGAAHRPRTQSGCEVYVKEGHLAL